MAALTWIIPAGQYERALNPTLGQEAPVPGTYTVVEQSPQGFTDVLMAPIAGLYNPATGMANAVDVAVFVLVIGGFLAVVTKTGAIDAGIGWLLKKLEGREIWMIPILMAAFAAGGTSYGMAEESLAFYAIVLPVMIRAGYDALTGVAVIMLGAGIGTLGSTFNAFATVIASNAAGVPFTDGLVLRVFILFACLAAGILYVMRYASRVKADPAYSVVAAQREENITHFLKGAEAGVPLPEFTRVRSIILALFGLTFAMMLYGVIKLGWWMGQMSALFLGMAILTWIVGKFAPETRLDEETFVNTFVNGARDLLGVALIIGVARGIVVVMDAGKITDTILNALAGWLAGTGGRCLHQYDGGVPDTPLLPRAFLLWPCRPDHADPRATVGLRRRQPGLDGHRLPVRQRMGESLQPDLRGGNGRAGDRAGLIRPLAAFCLAVAACSYDHHCRPP